MAGANATASESSAEHVAGKWYSVPDLRLRDHRFTVPLDYSVDRTDSNNLSVFAREVVAGTPFLNLPLSRFLLLLDCSISII